MCSVTVHVYCSSFTYICIYAYTPVYTRLTSDHRSVSSWSEHGRIQELILAPSNGAAPSECSEMIKARGLSLAKDGNRIG